MKALALAMLLVTATAFAQQKTTVVLGTATPGGGFPLYGAAFAEMVNAQEPTLSVEPRNTRGSTENVPLLESGKLDIALVAGDVANPQLARAGNALRIVSAMYASPGPIFRKRSPTGSRARCTGRKRRSPRAWRRPGKALPRTPSPPRRAPS